MQKQQKLRTSHNHPCERTNAQAEFVVQVIHLQPHTPSGAHALVIITFTLFSVIPVCNET